jgi:hypothetical protein
MRSFDRIYVIRRTPAGVTCTVNGRSLDPRLDLWNHSPSGFEFGYGGSGPAQLALAILADCCDDDTALECYQAFKWSVIAHIQPAGFDLTATQIHDVVAAIRADRSAKQFRNN